LGISNVENDGVVSVLEYHCAETMLQPPEKLDEDLCLRHVVVLALEVRRHLEGIRNGHERNPDVLGVDLEDLIERRGSV
jgi:hypothetical protein